MIEKEQHYVDLLRSQIASSPDEKKCLELAKTERNLQTLQAMLLRSQSEVSCLLFNVWCYEMCSSDSVLFVCVLVLNELLFNLVSGCGFQDLPQRLNSTVHFLVELMWWHLWWWLSNFSLGAANILHDINLLILKFWLDVERIFACMGSGSINLLFKVLSWVPCHERQYIEKIKK